MSFKRQNPPFGEKLPRADIPGKTCYTLRQVGGIFFVAANATYQTIKRAETMFSHGTLHSRQVCRPAAFPALVVLVCLSSILWLSIAPALMVTSCGILIPHDHLLLGGASQSDLQAHLAAEAACAGGVSGAALSAFHHHIGRSEVVSIPHVEDRSSDPGSILSLDQLTLAIPTLLAGSGLLMLLVWRLPLLCLVEHLLYLPPWDPPPEADPLPAR